MTTKMISRILKGGIGLAVAILSLTLSGSSAHAQFAQVKGAITDTQNVKVPKSSVHVNVKGASERVFEAPIGDYSIGNLQAGQYNFVACGIPHRPTMHKVAIKANQVTTLNLVLGDPPPNQAPAPFNMSKAVFQQFRESSLDGVVYLKDPKAGCFVAQAIPNDKGEVEFSSWQIGDQVCIRYKTGGETCPRTLNTSR